jgi:uncharacterized membrane protein YeaQ/YmgE (transglycosylase-associated protein family)
LVALVILLFVVLPLAGLALWALLGAIVVGLLLGALGRLVVPGSQPIGFLRTVLAGLVGSIVGGYIGHRIQTGHLATLLLEVGVAAVTVAGMSWYGRRLPGGYRRRSLSRGW